MLKVMDEFYVYRLTPVNGGLGYIVNDGTLYCGFGALEFECLVGRSIPDLNRALMSGEPIYLDGHESGYSVKCLKATATELFGEDTSRLSEDAIEILKLSEEEIRTGQFLVAA